MNKLIGILSLVLLLTVACKEEAVEVAPVEEVTPAVEEVIEEVVEPIVDPVVVPEVVPEVVPTDGTDGGSEEDTDSE